MEKVPITHDAQNTQRVFEAYEIEERRNRILELIHQVKDVKLKRVVADVRKAMQERRTERESTKLSSIGVSDRLLENRGLIVTGLADESLRDDTLSLLLLISISLGDLGEAGLQVIWECVPTLQGMVDTLYERTPSIVHLLALTAHHLKEQGSANASRRETLVRVVRESEASLHEFFRIPEEGRDSLGFSFLALLGYLLYLRTDSSDWVADSIVSFIVYAMRAGRITREEKRGCLSTSDIDVLLHNIDGASRLRILENVFSAFHLEEHFYRNPDGTISSSLTRQGSQPDEITAVVDQFYAISELEEARPGCAQALYSRFGIRWFSRYPKKVLIHQYDKRESAERPYGIVITSVADHTGAFFDEGALEVLASLHDQLDALGYDIRFVEIDHKNRIVPTALVFNALYGEDHRISFVLLRAHSSKHSMEFIGGTDDEADLTTNDIQKGVLNPLNNYLSESAAVIVEGCSIGRKSGLGYALSHVFNIAYVPRGLESGIEDISVRQAPKGELVFDVLYTINHNNEQGVPARKIRKGREIKMVS